jgi:uncharacterized protein
MVQRVLCSPAAVELINELKRKFGPLMFHLSGGCCDGSAPMCFELGDFRIGESDVLLGYVEECPFYKHTQLTLDVVQGRGSSFSIEIPMGKRFIIQSRLFSEQELNILLSNPSQ